MTDIEYVTIKNPDSELVKDIKKRIKNNGGHCPCQIDKDDSTKCPCKMFRETQECICGLYIRVPKDLIGE